MIAEAGLLGIVVITVGITFHWYINSAPGQAHRVATYTVGILGLSGVCYAITRIL